MDYAASHRRAVPPAQRTGRMLGRLALALALLALASCSMQRSPERPVAHAPSTRPALATSTPITPEPTSPPPAAPAAPTLPDSTPEQASETTQASAATPLPAPEPKPNPPSEPHPEHPAAAQPEPVAEMDAAPSAAATPSPDPPAPADPPAEAPESPVLAAITSASSDDANSALAKPAPAHTPNESTGVPTSVPRHTLVSAARSPREYRYDGAQHIYRHLPERIFVGKLPRLLFAVGVINIEIDTRGDVAAIQWARAPRNAPRVMDEIERLVRAAAPYPAPVHMGSVTYTDTWLWDKSGRFQLDTLTQGQD